MDDEKPPIPGVYHLQWGDAVVVFLAPGAEEPDRFDQDQLAAYFKGVTFHFIRGVAGVAVKPRD